MSRAPGRWRRAEQAVAPIPRGLGEQEPGRAPGEGCLAHALTPVTASPPHGGGGRKVTAAAASPRPRTGQTDVRGFPRRAARRRGGRVRGGCRRSWYPSSTGGSGGKLEFSASGNLPISGPKNSGFAFQRNRCVTVSAIAVAIASHLVPRRSARSGQAPRRPGRGSPRAAFAGSRGRTPLEPVFARAPRQPARQRHLRVHVEDQGQVRLDADDAGVDVVDQPAQLSRGWRPGRRGSSPRKRSVITSRPAASAGRIVRSR